MTLEQAIAEVRESWCHCSRSEMERTGGMGIGVPCKILKEVAEKMGIPSEHEAKYP